MRPLRIISVVCAVIIVALLIWKAGMATRSTTAPSHLEQTIHSAVDNPKEFVKSHVTGGVGVALMMDSASGLPRVGSVLPGSPAQSAGLLPGDLITKIGDWQTAGKSLPDVVETLRGFAGARVNLTVQRSVGTGSTNMTFAIHRSSWNSLGVNTSVSTGPGIALTNPAAILLITNATN